MTPPSPICPQSAQTATRPHAAPGAVCGLSFPAKNVGSGAFPATSPAWPVALA
jgi:hypothetical protein